MSALTEAQAITRLSELYEGDEINSILADVDAYGLFADEIFNQGTGPGTFDISLIDRVMLPNGLIIAVGLAEALLLVEVTLSTDGESSTAVGEQLTLVPGSVGSSASGGEAKVVAGAPGIVAAEK